MNILEPINGDRLMLVSLNRSFDRSKAAGLYKRKSLYDAVRKYWYASADRMKNVDYLLGVYRGKVVIVVRPTSYELVEADDTGKLFNKPRYVFSGEVVEDSPYLDTLTSSYPFGSGGAVCYAPKKF